MVDSSFNDILHHGLSGIGVDGSSGYKGIKGHSSYIGYIEMFFNVESFKDASYAYIRNKNIPDISSWENNSDIRDYRKSYEIPSTEWNKTFPFYNKDNYYMTDTSAYVDNSTNSPFFKYTGKDTSITDYHINNLWNVDTSHIENLNESRRNSINLSAVKIDNTDNNYEAAVDKVKEQWEKYATKDTVYPNNLNSERYHTGDTLYILNHDTDKLEYYIILTEDMENCSFDYFLNQNFIYCDSILNEFEKRNDRISINIDNFVIPDCSINKNLLKYNSSFLYNFIKHNVGDSAISIAGNDVSRNTYITFDDPSVKLDVDYNMNSYMNGDFGFTLRTPSCHIKDLYLKDSYTNMNIPEYYNDNILFLNDNFHIKSINSADINPVLNENDSLDLMLSFDYTKFLKNNISDYLYGLKIYYMENNNKKLLCKFEINQDDTSFIINISDIIIQNIDKFIDNAENQIYFICFVSGTDMTFYNSRISTLNFKLENNSVRTFSLQDADSENSIDTVSGENGISYINTDFIDFSSEPVVCEDCYTNLKITSKLVDSSIKDIYIDDIPFIKDYSILNDASLPAEEWFHLDSSNIEFADGSVYINNIHFHENLPPADASIKTLSEYFGSVYFSGKEIGDNIVETENRYMIVTVISSYNNAFFKSCYKICQPGFENPIPGIDISINPEISMNALEKSNKSENGILCNQIQLMDSISISGFSNDTWGKYFDNLRLKIFFNMGISEYEIGKDYSYTKNGKLHTINVYSMNDVKAFPGNAMKLHFSVIPNNNIIYYDSSVKNIDENEIPFKFYTRLVDYDNVTSDDFEEWIPLSKISRLKDSAETYLTGFDVSLQDASLSDIDITDALSENKILLRAFIEMSEPIPCEFNILWQIKRIEVEADVKSIFSDTNTHQTFYKDFNENQIIKSDNIKFIINPYYFTAFPDNMENYKLTESKGSMKWYGSEENIMLSTGLYPIDGSLLYDYSEKGLSYNLKNIRIANDAVDISYYIPKKEYFQDNIKSIYISPKNVRDITADVIDDSTSIFKKYFIDQLSGAGPDTSIYEYNLYLQKKFNIYPFTVNDTLNSSYSLNYLTLFYNIDNFNPITRNNEYYFYYNDNKLDAMPYNQFSMSDLTRRTPLLIEENAEIPLRDTSLLNSIDIWNEEYEHSTQFADKNIFGGSLTKSGDGYIFTNSDADKGQWNGDNTMYSLDDTKSLNSRYIPEDVSFIISDADEFTYHPDNGKYFRSLIWTAGWIYPNYIAEDSMKKIVPYKPVPSFVSYMDAAYTNGYYEDEYIVNKNYAENFTDYINSGNNTFPDDCFLNYKNFKITDIVTMQNAWLVNNLIPYNLMFDIYPRISYNVDMGENCYNILMLQQPSIRNKNNYEFKNISGTMPAHWWNISPSLPDASSDFMKNIASPWIFNQ